MLVSELDGTVSAHAGSSESRLIVCLGPETAGHERAEVELPVHKRTSARRAAVNKKYWMARAAADIECFQSGNVDVTMFEVAHAVVSTRFRVATWSMFWSPRI